MNGKVGTLNGNMVWLFALGAVALGIGAAYATAGLGSKVSSGAFFGVFLVAGFLGTLLTRARTGIAVAAFLVASLLASGTYYAIATSMVATAAAETGVDAVGSMLGTFLGLVVAAVTLLVSLAGGIGGCVAGARAKRTILATGGA